MDRALRTSCAASCAVYCPCTRSVRLTRNGLMEDTFRKIIDKVPD